MKKLLSYVFIAILAINLSNCSRQKPEPITEFSNLKGKIIGMKYSTAPQEFVFDALAKGIGGEPKKVLYFNRSSDLISAIKTGKIDAAPFMKFVADYYVKRNNNLTTVSKKEKSQAIVLMAVRSDDQKLKEDLDSAITALRENGMLKILEDEWITNLPVNNEPSNIELPKFEGAKTYFVGITGDYAPLDYIAADGKPAGYNVAFLSEIAKLLNINFEFVSLEAQARFPALGSKRIDIVFCQYYSDKVTEEFNRIKNKIILTKPYYTTEDGYFIVRK